ncbi:hypothetical protein QUA46_28250 [Microcoleus sp. MON2_D6]|uniref:hypothetical protein n=1 Tax=unclassified Microcoleus TaxID=2642155 RepID=UPI002FCFA173
MEPVSNESQQPSNLAHTPLNTDSQVLPSPTGQLQQNSNSLEPASFSLRFSGWELAAGRWAVLGIVVVATACTFFLLTKGSEFCFFSTCTTANTTTTSLATNFWGFLGGAATLMILTNVLGVALVPAVAVAMGIWLLMQISLH